MYRVPFLIWYAHITVFGMLNIHKDIVTCITNQRVCKSCIVGLTNVSLSLRLIDIRSGDRIVYFLHNISSSLRNEPNLIMQLELFKL